MSADGVKRKRLTKDEKNERKEFSQKELRTKQLLSNQISRASELRTKDKDFYGLEREFMYLQDKMLKDFISSKDIKHPRDLGMAREELLKRFFHDNNFLPRKFSISKSSVRVASTSGHLSNELDILFYDTLNSFSLMQRQDVFEILPVECCYGTIQVKSKLTKKELSSAFDNIRSFKKLKKSETNKTMYIRGEEEQASCFGIIFAYESDLDWADLVIEIKNNSQLSERKHLPNAIFILSKGFFMFGDDKFGSVYNSDIENFSSIKVYGHPDRDGMCLYNFYDITFNLLSKTNINDVSPHQYFRLPLTAGEYSYRYSLGYFTEVASCDKHGEYVKEFSPEKLEKIISWCEGAEKINWVKAMDLAYGRPTDNIKAYELQAGEVTIYNPCGLPLSDILLMDRKCSINGEELTTKALACDSIETCNLIILIPYYYMVKDQLLQGCTKCSKTLSPKTSS